MHVHVAHPEGEAKFWIEPTIALAVNDKDVVHTAMGKREAGGALLRAL